MPRRHGCRQSFFNCAEPGLPSKIRINPVNAGIKMLKMGAWAVQKSKKLLIKAHPLVGHSYSVLLWHRHGLYQTQSDYAVPIER